MDEHRIKAAARRAEGKLEDAVDSVAPIAERMGSLARETGEKAVSVARDTVQKVGTQASDAGGRLYDESLRAGKSLSRTIGEKPLGTVLVAAALGYGLAYLMHRRGDSR
jgi:ElaB/YqjD/DUF883 family membrane-anchored ribosome-binding protein